MIYRSIIIALSILAAKTNAGEVTIIVDGSPVVERGIFIPGCYYGKEASVSDHAPIIWDSQKLATWNIANRVSHLPITKGLDTFLGHKFFTDQKYTLINEAGEPAIPGKKSELDGLVRNQEIVNEHFGLRLKQVAAKIKEVFLRHDLKLMAIQEVPNHLKKHTDGENLQQMMADILSPELTIQFAKRPPIKTEWAPDVAVITKPGIRLNQWMVDTENRLQPFCMREVCYVASHIPFPKTERQAIEQCHVIKNLARKLNAKGHSTIIFLGDFNRSAEHIQKVCGTIDGFVAEVRTSDVAQSCHDNNGSHAERTIDLMLTITKPD